MPDAQTPEPTPAPDPVAVAPLGPTMPAAVYTRPGQMQVQDRPVPAVGPHDALIEVSHCGVCGSDLHFILEGWGRPDSIPGHEFSGRIVAVGSAVRDWEPGALVVGGPLPQCGACPMCQAGRPSLCEQRHTPGKDDYQGAFASYALVHEDQLRRIPEGLSLREAALAEPLAIALHALTIGGLSPRGGPAAPNTKIMVSGAGPIGALIVAAWRARGGEDITVIEPGATRRQLALDLGATRVVGPDELQVPTIAEPETIQPDAVDVVFECSGRRTAMEAGLAQLRRGGTLVIVGAGIDPPHFDSNRILLNELVITGSFNYDADGFEQALAMLASGALPLDLLIDGTDVPLDGVVAAMHDLVEGHIAGKVMVVPRPGATLEEADR